MDQAPNRINELRLAKNRMSQEALAARIGVTTMSLSRMERGKQPVSIEMMRRIAEALGCEPADLLAKRDNPMQLNDEERELIARYRTGSADQRQSVQRVTAALIPGADVPDRDVA